MVKTTEHFYQAFPAFVFRTPCFRLNTDLNGRSPDRDIFSEALFLASPELCSEIEKYDSLSSKEKLKLDITLYKYASRACSRCTPFGLFAGCSMGKWGNRTHIRLSEPQDLHRRTRVDMNYLCALIQHLEKQPVIADQLLYYTNDSLYEYGGGLRYVEYYFRETKQMHNLGSVEISVYLQQVLSKAEQGATVDELAQLLVNEEVSHTDARGFILELIDSQLLKSELEVAVTGKNPLDVLLERLGQLQNVDTWMVPIRQIHDLLSKIDSKPVGTTRGLYDRIIALIQKLGVPFEQKYLFQTDMFKPGQAMVSDTVRNELYRVISFLNKITPKAAETNMTRFRNAFWKRYEEAEVPLMQVLDNDLGLGYPIREGDTGDINSFVDDLSFPVATRSSSQIYFHPIDALMLRKYAEALKAQAREIVLEDADVADFPTVGWNDLPDTFSVICKMLGNNSGPLYIQSCGGTSAGNLLGRFCHLDPDLRALVKSIAKKEQELNPDMICAEIVHLPESRIGNILSRPVFRDYEIPYLANSGVDSTHRLKLSELTLSVRHDRVILKSTRFGKEVLPHLTTAHNYSRNALPVYRFLCDLQAQNLRVGLSFQWGSWARGLDYLPRVTYRGHILARQRWILSVGDFKHLDATADEHLPQKLDEVVRACGLPRYFILPDSDNELLIDSWNPVSIRTMLNHVKRRDKFYVEEFLFDNPQALDVCGGWTNEFIFAFYRTNQ